MMIRVASLASRLCLILALAGLVVALPGCGIVERLTGEAARKQQRAEEAKARSQELQLKVMRFADTYSEQVVAFTGRMSPFAEGGDDPAVRQKRQDLISWQLAQATAAVQIAAGPRPPANALDMVVLVHLTHGIVARSWPSRYGEDAGAIVKLFEGLEPMAWKLLDGLASEQQMAEFRNLLDRFSENTPGLETAAFLRFADIASAGGKTREKVSPGLLGIVGLDPLEGIDPAIREFEQTRQLAERVVYYLQRMPALVELQVARATERIGGSDQMRRTVDSVERVGLLAESMARTSDELPQLIARERQAAIDQVMTNLAAQQSQMLALATELRQALEAGAVTADKLDEVVNSVDQLVARFEPAPGAPPAEPGRPFDVNEYTRLVVELAATAKELQSLTDDLGQAAPRLLERADQLTLEARALVDYAFVRLLLLVGVILAAAIAYLVVSRRLRAAD
jgi:hypothetical protein